MNEDRFHTTTTLWGLNCLEVCRHFVHADSTDEEESELEDQRRGCTESFQRLDDFHNQGFQTGRH